MNLKRFYSLDFVGRLLLSSVFINAIPGKVLNFSNQVEYIISKGISESFAIILLIGATLLLIAGSFILIFSSKTRLACSMLITFLIPTTIIFHLVPLEPFSLARNLSLIGGLLIAIDRSCLT